MFEIYKVDDPSWVCGRWPAGSAEEALLLELQLYPRASVDLTALTITTEMGAHGVREVH